MLVIKIQIKEIQHPKNCRLYPDLSWHRLLDPECAGLARLDYPGVWIASGSGKCMGCATGAGQ